MFPTMQRLIELYNQNPCHCKGCGIPLPISHSADHLCEPCFDAVLERETIEYLAKIKEVLFGDEKQEDGD